MKKYIAVVVSLDIVETDDPWKVGGAVISPKEFDIGVQLRDQLWCEGWFQYILGIHTVELFRVISDEETPDTNKP